MNNIYTIYHIPDYMWSDGDIGKIGCTDNLKRRISCYKGHHLSDIEILEEHTDVYEVSDREIELQKEYGYKVDKIPYWKTLKIGTKAGRLKGGKIGGKISGNNNVKSGQIHNIQKIGCKLGGKAAGKQQYKNKTGMFSPEIQRLARKKSAQKRSKPIIQMDLDGNFIKEWKSAAQCCKESNLKDPSSIGNVCKGKYKQYKGYIFKYKE